MSGRAEFEADEYREAKVRTRGWIDREYV